MMKKWMERLKKDERGLTLVELLAVIVILGIVGAIAFVSIGNIMENSRQDAHIANAQQLISSAKLYEASEGSIDGGIDSGDLVSAGYLDAFTSPWDEDNDEKNSYSGTVTKNGTTYSVILNGNDCNIDADESEINTDDRETLCASGSVDG